MVQVGAEQGLQQIAPCGIHVQGLAAFRHGGKGSLQLLIGPAGLIAHHAGCADEGGHVEAGGDLIEAAVDLHGLQHVFKEIVPLIVLVAVQIRVEVLQQALGGQLPVGHLIEAEQIRHLAGHDLRDQLGAAGIVILILRVVVLGIIPDLDPDLVGMAVEFHHGVIDIIAVDHSQRQGLLVGDAVIGSLEDPDQLALDLFVAVTGQHAHEGAVLPEVNVIEIAAVDIHIQEVQQLFIALLGDIIAVEVHAVHIVKVILFIPAHGVVGLGRDLDGIAKRLLFQIQGVKGYSSVAPAHDAKAAVPQAQDPVGIDIGRADLHGEAAVRPEGEDALIPGNQHGAVLGKDAGTEVHPGILKGIIQLDAFLLGAVLIQAPDIVFLDVAVLFPGSGAVGLHLRLGAVEPTGIEVFHRDQVPLGIHPQGAEAGAGIKVQLIARVLLRGEGLISGKFPDRAVIAHEKELDAVVGSSGRLFRRIAFGLSLPFRLGGLFGGGLLRLRDSAVRHQGTGRDHFVIDLAVKALIGIDHGRNAVGQDLVIQLQALIGIDRVRMFLRCIGLLLVLLLHLSAGGQAQNHGKHQQQAEKRTHILSHRIPP